MTQVFNQMLMCFVSVTSGCRDCFPMSLADVLKAEGPAASGSPLPKVKLLSKVPIEGVETDFLFNHFADRIFIVISQTGRIGTVVRL